MTLGVSHLFPGKEIPQELDEARRKNPNRREGWDNLCHGVVMTLNELNLPKEMIVEGYANDGFLIEEMDDVIKTFYVDHDIIIISDGHKHSIEEFMKKHGLHQYLKGIFAKPYVIKENGQVVLEDSPIEWSIKEPCDAGGCWKTCKAEMVKFFLKNKNYKTTTYVGDGKNDLCPVLNLKSEDRVFARKDHPLLSLLTNGEHDIKAKVISWKTGIDILSVL